ncbi:mitochondrial ribonuclease P catalytic subunit isoform X2 [Dermacentor variabilis]|uniref:mitochondrial ribonuclease P catalytic subunit isoform X2 n=1 Tax=Dermacentor variabilis TaxID=34621 RepID=UPI003F5B9FB3
MAATAAWRRCFARLASAAYARKTASQPDSAAVRAEQLYAQVVEYAAGRPLSPKDWARFEQQHNPAMRLPFRSQLMSCLAARRDHAMAHSLLEYAEGVAGGVTRMMLAHYLALCSTEQQADACLRRILESSGGLLDLQTRNLVVRSLCQTPLWNRATEFLGEPGAAPEPVNAVAVAGFQHDDFSIAWECLERLRGSQPLRIFPSTIEACLKAARTMAQRGHLDEGRQLVDRLLMYLAAGNHGPLPSSLALSLSSFYSSWAAPGWSNGLATVSRDSICNRCGRQLEMYRLSDAEWEQLRRGVLERCLEGDDPYLGSNPRELAKFRDFLKRAPAYGVVLDGLNVALSGKDRAQELLKAVQHYAVKEKQAILLVGRKHMLHWHADIMDQVWKRCLRYLANDTSHDDPFVLYAALHGGPGTIVVSRDLMRQHRFRLSDPRLQELFTSWQHLHQVEWRGAPVSTTVPHKVIVQGSSTNGWHVPHVEENGTVTAAAQWLCIAPAAVFRPSKLS